MNIRFGSVVLAVGLCALMAAAQEKPAGGISWAKDLESAMTQSQVDGRPVITYFTFDT